MSSRLVVFFVLFMLSYFRVFCFVVSRFLFSCSLYFCCVLFINPFASPNVIYYLLEFFAPVVSLVHLIALPSRFSSSPSFCSSIYLFLVTFSSSICFFHCFFFFFFYLYLRVFLFFLMLLRPPISTFFPTTTFFRPFLSILGRHVFLACLLLFGCLP